MNRRRSQILPFTQILTVAMALTHLHFNISLIRQVIIISILTKNNTKLEKKNQLLLRKIPFSYSLLTVHICEMSFFLFIFFCFLFTLPCLVLLLFISCLFCGFFCLNSFDIYFFLSSISSCSSLFDKFMLTIRKMANIIAKKKSE